MPVNRFAPGADRLFSDGPWLPVAVEVPSAHSRVLVAHGLPVPQPVVGRALVDTGATHTCIDKQVAKRLGLPPLSSRDVLTASGITRQPVYFVMLTIATDPAQKIDPLPVLGADLAAAAHGLIALIGRDLLARMALLYLGPAGEWALLW